MQKLRPFLTALLGLTLWVQGLAVAAAPAPVADRANTTMEMPCHGDEAPGIASCDCCDGDCENMAGCLVGSFAAAPAAFVLADAPAHAAVATRAWAAKTAISPLPLRPPIVSRS